MSRLAARLIPQQHPALTRPLNKAFDPPAAEKVTACLWLPCLSVCIHGQEHLLPPPPPVPARLHPHPGASSPKLCRDFFPPQNKQKNEPSLSFPHSITLRCPLQSDHPSICVSARKKIKNTMYSVCVRGESWESEGGQRVRAEVLASSHEHWACHPPVNQAALSEPPPPKKNRGPRNIAHKKVLRVWSSRS